MKLRRATVNLRKRQFDLITRAGTVYPMPFAKVEPRPTVKDPIREFYVDPELANEGITYVLTSGKEGAVLLDHALDYNRDPAYLAEMALYQLTCEALARLKVTETSMRELARRLGTSTPQVYRLLDTTNYSKSFAQMFALLQVLDCDIRIVVKPRPGSLRTKARSRHRKAA